jgi:CheY-like chemotaxis protein
VRIRVADRGPGIAPHVLPRLFQPFQTTKGGHHGLGLAGSQAALEPFGARIEARNDPTGGAVFEIVLEDAGVGLPAPRCATPAPAVARPAHNLRILAVDDDADVLSLVQIYLEPLGYRVATMTDADAAIQAATEAALADPFDVVLCDLAMPRHNGLELCRLLRQTGYRGKLVLMTGWDTHTLTAEQLAAGCDAVLKKPFAGAELTHAIEELVAPPSGEGSPAQ